MKKYLFVIKTELQRQLTYRLDIYGYRLGNLLEVFALLSVWIVTYRNTDVISGYTQNQMITYVLVGWLFIYLTRSYGLYEKVADNIYEGTISDFLVKPISYLRYMVVLSLGRSSVSLISSVFIQLAVILVFSEYIIFDLDIARGLILFLMLIASYFINVFMSLVIGMIAFWTQKIDGIDYTINSIMKFLSGAYFPISLLPLSFLKFDMFFPFIYTVYVPTQLYLGKISIREGLRGLFVEIIWIVILYVIIKIMWKRGIKRYEGVGI